LDSASQLRRSASKEGNGLKQTKLVCAFHFVHQCSNFELRSLSMEACFAISDFRACQFAIELKAGKKSVVEFLANDLVNQLSEKRNGVETLFLGNGFSAQIRFVVGVCDLSSASKSLHLSQLAKQNLLGGGGKVGGEIELGELRIVTERTIYAIGETVSGIVTLRVSARNRTLNSLMLAVRGGVSTHSSR
jgi:hypothetical protein